MKRMPFWIFCAVALALGAFLVVRHRYVINSVELEASIEHELPPGTPKAKVIDFLRARKPLAYDDFGLHLKARISGLAPNMIYHKDVILVFDFDDKEKLLAHSRQETLTCF